MSTARPASSKDGKVVDGVLHLLASTLGGALDLGQCFMDRPFRATATAPATVAFVLASIASSAHVFSILLLFFFFLPETGLAVVKEETEMPAF